MSRCRLCMRIAGWPLEEHVRITAAVLRQPGQPFVLEDIDLARPRPDEVLVRVESVGLCATDVEFSGFFGTPAVLGHEGAGIVEGVGARVTAVAPGDRVTMTFASCGGCPTCLGGAPSYCRYFDALNFTGRRPDGSTALSDAGAEVNGHFLGQSSFATHVVAPERAVVPVARNHDLSIAGPFGCGFQTGAGAVINVLRPAPGASLAVFGAGGVGLTAVMAAVLTGCSVIAAVDLDPARLRLARELGATHTATPDEPGVLTEAAPHGFDFAIDTTGHAAVLRTAVESLGPLGRCGVVGVGPSQEMTFDWRSVLNGRSVTGIVGGSSLPPVFIPRLLDLHSAGRFPVDRLITRFPLERINDAVRAVREGAVCKAVLTV